MELKHIELSDDMRARLETSLGELKNQNKTHDAKELLSAFSAAIWGTHEDCKKFGLKSLNDNQRSAELASAIIGMANGSSEPALVVDNLPEDKELYQLALRGLNLSMNTGEVLTLNRETKKPQKEKGYYTEKANTIIPLVFGDPISLRVHGTHLLHSDKAGKGTSPELRIIGSGSVGNNPLPTRIATVSEMINVIADSLINKRSGYEAIKDWDEEKIKSEIIRILKAPLWEPVPIMHYIEDSDKKLETNAAIYENHEKLEGAPEYGLLRDPSQMKLAQNISEGTLDCLNINSSVLRLVNNEIKNTLRILKTQAAGLVVKRGQALLFNDHLVIHGTGNFQYEDVLPKDRCIYNLNAAAGIPVTLEETQTPGVVPLSSSIQMQPPKIVNKQKELAYDT